MAKHMRKALSGRTRLLPLAAWALAASLGAAADVHVNAAAGSDATGDGSPAAPVRTITRAAALAAPGDVIRVAAGLYDPALGELFPIRPVAGVSLVGAGRDVTIIEGSHPAPSEFPRTPLIILQAPLLADGSLQVSGFTSRGGHEGLSVSTDETGASVAFVTDCAFEQHSSYGLTIVPLHASGSIRVARCRVQDSRLYGIFATGMGSIAVEDCIVERCGTGLYGSSRTPVPMSIDASRNAFRQCYDGARIHGSEECQLTAVLTQNVISDNTHAGVSANSYFDGSVVELTVERSVITGNGGPGILAECLFADSRLTTQSTGNLIAGNGEAGIEAYLFRTTQSLIRSANDTIVGNGTGIDGGDVFATFADNAIIRGNVTAQVTTQVSVNDSNLQGSGGAGTNIDLDPLFVDEAGGDFRLAAGSPCIDAARGDFLPSRDLDGRSRPLDDAGVPNSARVFATGGDLGAFESVDADVDVDLDGLTEAEGDCLEGDASQRVVPGEVTGLRVALAAGDLSLRWDDDALVAGSALTYDLVAGPLGPRTMSRAAPFVGRACAATGIAVPRAALDATADRWFVVRGVLPTCGAGSFSEIAASRLVLDTGGDCR